MPFTNGLQRDTDKRLQPDNSYRDAQNAVIESEDGEIRREKGLKKVLDIAGYSVRGTLNLSTGKVLLFLQGSPNKISIFDDTSGTLTDVLTDDQIVGSLSFADHVQAEYREIATGDRVVYWTDGSNPPRFLNIDQNPPSSVKGLQLFPRTSTKAEFNLLNVGQYGGSLTGGTYQLAFAYVDQDQSSTNYFLTSGPINTTGRAGYGADSDQNTGQSINFELSNLDTSFDFLRIAVVKETEVKILSDFGIPEDGTFNYTYTGGEEATTGTIEQIAIDQDTYKKAGTMAEQSGVLYMGDLEKPVQHDIQAFVNNWEVDVVSKPLSEQTDANKPPERLFQDPDVAHAFRTYKRGEAYALYATFVLEDGSETPAFHIPGRPPTGSSDEKARASITIDDAAPDPSDGKASGTVEIQNSINSQGQVATQDPVVNIESDTSADDTFDAVLYDGTDNEVVRVSVSVASGESAETIATAIKNALNGNSTFQPDWTAGVSDGGSGVWEISLVADQTGSEYNGYYVDLENDAGNFTYDNTGNVTTGGKDDTADAPDEDITLTWDDKNQSVTVTVSTLNGEDDPPTVASKFVTALNDNSTISSNFTATDNGDGTFLIEADQIGKTYNGNFTWSLNLQKSLSEATIDGGWDTANDVLSYTVKWSPRRPTTDFTVDDGASAQAVADAILNACQNNGNYSDLQFTQNGTTINATDQSGTADLNGDRPDIYGSPDPLTYSEHIFEGGGSESNAEAVVKFDGAAPEPSDGNAIGTIDAPAIPSQEEKADADQFTITSGASEDGSVDIEFLDPSGIIQSSVTINYLQGDSAQLIANRIATELGGDSTAGSDFQYSVKDRGGGKYQIYMKAKSTGSQWNDYNIQVGGPPDFNYNYGAGGTTGGKDANDDAPDYNARVEWERSDSGFVNQVDTIVSTLNGEDDPSTSASKITTALQNNSSFTDHFSATDNGDGSITIEADSIGRAYNGRAYTIRTSDDNLFTTAAIDGGWDSANDQFDLFVDFNVNGAEVKVAVDAGESASSIATRVHNKFVNDDPDGGTVSYILEDNDTQIRARELSGTSDPNGTSPDVDSLPDDNWSVSITNWEGGGASSSTSEYNEISDQHPLAKYKDDFEGPIRNFHHSSTPTDESNMGYWENAVETYPDDERWKVKDVSGAVIGDLRGKRVRHHRMPDTKTGNSMEGRPYDAQEVHVLGLKIKNADIPEEYKDRIQGYRIYYAEKQPDDRLMLTQNRGIFGFLDDGRYRHHQHAHNIFEDTVWNTHGLPREPNFDGNFKKWNVDRSLLQLHPMDALRRDLNVAGVTHVKLSARLWVPTEEDVGQLEVAPVATDTIKAVKAAAYVDRHKRKVRLKNLGFSYDYDNVFGERKMVLELETPETNTYHNYQVDVCQLKKTVHRPFENQNLIWTGFTGDLGKTESDVFYGGDIYIGEHIFKAHTLLGLADKDQFTDEDDNESDYAWWGRNHDDGDLRKDGRWLGALGNELFGRGAGPDGRGDGPDIKEVNGLQRALRELIGDTGGIEALPIAWGTDWKEVVECRDNPLWRQEGEREIDVFRPASQEWVETPNFGDMPEEVDNMNQYSDDNVRRKRGYLRGRWIFRFFTDSDNFYKYNDEYRQLQSLKTPFAYRKQNLYPTNFPSRVIRSARTKDGGPRRAWRSYRPEDNADLPQNRGRITNIAALNSGLLIHTEQSIFRTRGRKRLQVQDEQVYLGTGNIFKVDPEEMQNLEAGFGGLQDSLHAKETPWGYFWIDADAQKVYRMSKKMQEVSRKGLRTWFQENVEDDDDFRIGIHPDTERLFVENQGKWTLSYNPLREIWVSTHDIEGDRYFATRDRGFNVNSESIYEIGEGEYGEYYGNVKPFRLEFVSADPQPENKIVVSLWVDCEVLDASGQKIENETIDSVRIFNDHQDTGVIPVHPVVSEIGQRNPQGNARKTDRVWKINGLRDHSSSGSPRSSLERLTDNVHTIEMTFGESTVGRTIHILNALLVRRSSKR